MEAGSGALLDELDAIIPHISGGSASVEDFVAKKKAVAAAHQDNPRHIEASCEVFSVSLFLAVCSNNEVGEVPNRAHRARLREAAAALRRGHALVSLNARLRIQALLETKGSSGCMLPCQDVRPLFDRGLCLDRSSSAPFFF